MPSDKPQILIRTNKELIEKLDIIAKSCNRSRGNLAETVLLDYVQNYEKQNGNIVIGEINQSGTGNSINIG
uniref:hypothetical protein n=1 Tax=Acetatifactor sp. TaxID=1872090 RepID=UPI004055CB01